MILRANDATEIAQAAYMVTIRMGCVLQLVVLTTHRTDINRLLADMQQFVNLSNMSKVRLIRSLKLVKHLVIENSSNREYIFNDAEAKTTYYCKVFQRLVLGTTMLYVAVPAILEFQASRSGATLIVHPDVGFFNDM